jgi:hypothetical protein
MGNAPLLMLCMHEQEDIPAGPQLLRPQFGMARFRWPESTATEYCLPHGEMVRLLRANAFDVLDLIELQPGPEATTPFPYVSLEWARQWPSEEVRRARRR